jgi:hypothetical protein
MLGFAVLRLKGVGGLRFVRVVIAFGISGIAGAACGGVAREDEAADNGGNGGTGGAAGMGAGAGMGAAAGVDGSTTPLCPDDAWYCPQGCRPVTALRYSVERACITSENEVVGCNGTRGGASICIKRVRDGAIFVAGNSPLEGPAWTACSADDGFRPVGCSELTCSAPEVKTISGCLSCDAVGTTVTALLGSAHEMTSRCQTSTDCVCEPSSTRCAGACDVSVSAELAADYREMVRIVDQQYCSDPGYASICGSVTPRCLPCASSCRNGVCTALPPP